MDTGYFIFEATQNLEKNNKYLNYLIDVLVIFYMIRGVCSLSVIPVRTEPSDRSEQCTQLLFGELYTVLAETEDKKWLQIQIAYDSYTGWISAIQHFAVPDNYYEAYLQEQHPVCSGYGNYILEQGHKYMLLPGGVLPFYTKNKIRIGSKEYNLEGSHIRMPHAAISLIKVAAMYLKSPYMWGGKTPFGIDCSGFTQQVFRIGGIPLPRDAWQQATCGTPIDHLDNTRPGDLVFFDNDKGRIIHVGIIIEKNKIIHASGEVRIDQLDTQGIWNKDRNIYTHKLRNIQRMSN
jgi:gamma-D-glutamyl-L-lysine dipeptidyl-peptidase